MDLNRPSRDLSKDDILFHQQQGSFHVWNYHALLQGVEKAKDNDKQDHEKGVAKTNAKWRASKVALLVLLCNRLKIDSLTGSGCFTPDEAKKARQAIQQDAALVRYITFKLHLKVNSQLPDAAFVNKLFKKLLGIRVSGKLIRGNKSRYRLYTHLCP